MMACNSSITRVQTRVVDVASNICQALVPAHQLLQHTEPVPQPRLASLRSRRLQRGHGATAGGRQGMPVIARHVIGCRSTQEPQGFKTRVDDDDVASNVLSGTGSRVLPRVPGRARGPGGRGDGGHRRRRHEVAARGGAVPGAYTRPLFSST
jgi:hypothetical protein